MSTTGSYLKKHTEALVKDVGIEVACQLTGKSKGKRRLSPTCS
ncbi:hypothetical protein [Cypionkella sp.]|nr:hypothetical protein [Cypionkella sp.]